jgi:NAD(P)-dependent dehydrogenase (short-subunit alcohol dehydrogenase family)
MNRHNRRPLTGRCIAITGAGRGIGRATARELHQRGAQIAIGDIDIDAAKEAATAIGSGTEAYPLDVTDSESFGSFLDQAKQAMGGLDVLINNAGVMPIGHFLEIPERVVRRSMDWSADDDRIACACKRGGPPGHRSLIASLRPRRAGVLCQAGCPQDRLAVNCANSAASRILS